MPMGVKELVKEINWLIEKIELSLDEWADDVLLNHSHDGNFVLVDANIVNQNLASRIKFLKDQLEIMKKKVEEP